MDFALDETQRELGSLARRVFTDHATHDRLKALEAGGQSFDAELWETMRTSGLLDVGITDGGFLEQCVVLLEQGRTVAPVPLWAHYVGASALGSAAGLVSIAVDDADGYGGNALALEHATALVLVSGERVTTFDPSSISSERRETTAGFPEYVVGFDGGEAVNADAATLRRRCTVALCALGVGVAERALEITASYTSERKQFDRPLGSFQAVQQRAANAYIDVEAMRWTMWQAAWRLAHDRPADREIAIAKFWAAEGGQRVVSAAQHLHGGMGSDVDYPLYRYTLWAKWIELAFGGATRQLVRLGSEIGR